MNAKQTAPLLVTLAPAIAAAPAVIVGGAIGLGIVLLIKAFSNSDTEKEPETPPAQPEAEISRKPAETLVFREVPAKSAIQPASVSVLSAPRLAVPPASVRPVYPAPVQPAAPVPKAATPATSSPIIKKFVTRENLATIFDNGARSLSRTAAVAALKRLGFGKTAAYAALSPDGRFNAWMHCAPDGIITWKN